MQRPTATGLRIRSPADAQVIFHAVSLNVLPMVSRRLDTEERRAINSGSVFVWEERGPNAEATGLGIERWTDGIRWGPSRVRDEFLFYHERDPDPVDVEMNSDSDTTFGSQSRPNLLSQGPLRDHLVKQTYSVFVDTPRGKRKWHLIAYFTQDSLDYLRSIEDIPQLASLAVPRGMYKSARSAKRPRDDNSADRSLAELYGVPSPYYAYTPATTQHLGISEATHPSQFSDGADASRLPVIARRNADQRLAPLQYLQNIAPRRRHPLDEEALMSFTPGLTLVLA